MSGSNHGTCGGPDRLCHTRSHSRSGAAAAATNSAVWCSWASYSPPSWPGRAGHLDRDRVGDEDQSGASRGAGATVFSAARTPSASGWMKPGWS